MDITTLQDALATMGIAENQPVLDKHLHIINMENEGNFYYDYFGHVMIFDTDKSLLKVKYYSSALVSSKFYKAEKTATSTFKVSGDIFGSYSIKSMELFNAFRNPEVGDIIYTINPNGSLAQAATISSFSNGVIVSSADLDLNNKVLCYASGKALEISGGEIQTKDANVFVEDFLDNHSVLILRRPLTNFSTDEYFSIENIEGFSLKRFGSIANLLVK